jgi:membrane protein
MEELNMRDVVLELKRRFNSHNVTAFSAQMAFFFFLSLFPFIIFLFSLLSLFDISTADINFILARLIPAEGYNLIANYSANVVLDLKKLNVFSVSILIILWSASRVIFAFTRSLNNSYSVEETRGYFKTRIMGMIYTVVLMLMIILGIVVTITGEGFFNFVRKFIYVARDFQSLFFLFKWIVYFGVFFVILLIFYRNLPNLKLKLKSVIPGSVFAIFAISIFTFLFSLYINTFSNYSILYGSLGAVVVLMMWLYLVSGILVLGGEINAILMRKK